ncbi:MAG: hypothetical protein L3J46_01075 [Kangiellaceae bacterium]|nr:hypothetical protein [Kangiellaceae bacterium]
MAGRKKFRLAAKKLIKAVKSNENVEREKLITFQTEKLAIEANTAKKNAKRIINERKFIVRNLVSGLIDKNVEAISLLDQDISNLTDKYHQLKVGLATTEPITEDVPVEKVEQSALVENKSKELKKEIKNLKQEVHITLTTLNNIFKEFSSMFGEDDVTDSQMSVDQIITAMASFAGKSNSTTEIGTNKAADTDTNEVAEVNEEPETEIESELQAEVGAKDESESDPIKVTTTQQPDESEPVKSEPAKSEDASGAKPDEKEVKKEQAVPTPDPKDDAADKADDLDFSVDAAIDDIDSALDELELDSTDEEPDWGDAFAESGDTMEGDPNKS